MLDVTDAGVGVAVGEHHDPPDGLGPRAAVEQLERLEPAARQVGAAAAADRPDLCGGGLAVLVVTEGQHHLDPVVERDDCDAVIGTDPANHVRGGFAHGAQRLARHGAGTVEHEDEVDGCAVRCRGLGGLELEHHVHDLVDLDSDDVAVEADVGLHGNPPWGV